MAVDKGLVSKASLTAIGNAIRKKNKTTTKYTPSEMAAAISELKTGDFTVATSDKFNFKVVQSANQIITSTPAGKAVNNSDGTVSVALTDTTTISPNTNYIPGAVQRSYDDSTHTYTVTATDAEPIDGLVQDGWSVVYHKEPGENKFYSNAKYTGSYKESYELQGNILIGGMKNPNNTNAGYYPSSAHKMIKYKNTFVTGVEDFLLNCENVIEVEAPNLINVGRYLLRDCSSLTHIELPNLTTVGVDSLNGCKGLRSIELPKLTVNGEDDDFWQAGSNSASSPNYFIDLGSIARIYDNPFIYTQVMVLRAGTVPTNFKQSKLSDPVLYIVPSALVDTYKSKVRSSDYVTALEKSPFADGKTVCGNNMKTVYQSRSEIWLGEGTSMVWHARSDEWMYDTYYPQSDGNSSDQAVPSVANVMRAPEPTDRSFRFFSKLTKEQGYIIPT